MKSVIAKYLQGIILFVLYLIMHKLSFLLFNEKIGFWSVMVFSSGLILLLRFFYINIKNNPHESCFISCDYPLKDGRIFWVCLASGIILGFLAHAVSYKSYYGSLVLNVISLVIMTAGTWLSAVRNGHGNESCLAGKEGVSGAEETGGYTRKTIKLTVITLISTMFCGAGYKAFSVSNYSFALLMFVFGMMMFIPVIKAGQQNKIKENGIKLIDWFFVLIVFTVAAVLRIYKLDQMPSGIGMEEIEAMKWVTSPAPGTEFIYGTLNHPLMQFEILRFFGSVTDFTLSNLRLLDAVAGSLVTVFVYFIAKAFFGRMTAIISSFIYAFMYLSIFYSRVVFFWIFPVFFVAAMVCCLIYAFKYQRPLLYALSGLFAGLSMYSYHSGKVAVIIAPAVLVLFALYGRERSVLISSWPNILLFFSSSFIVLLPLISYILREPKLYFARMSAEGFHLPAGFDISILNAYFYKLFHHFAYVLSTYFKGNTAWGGYAAVFEPLIDPATSFLFFIGAGLFVLTWKNIRSSLMLLLLFLSMAPALFSSGDAPSRMLVVLPFMAVTAGYALYTFSYCMYFAERRFKILVFTLIAVTFGVFITYDNVSKYFVRQHQDPSFKLAYADTLKQMADYASKQKNSKIIFSAYYYEKFDQHMHALLMQYGMKSEAGFFPGLMDMQVFYDEKGRDAVVFMEGIYKPQADALKFFFPEAEVIRHPYPYHLLYTGDYPVRHSYWGRYSVIVSNLIKGKAGDQAVNLSDPRTAFISVKVPADNIRSLFGLNASFYKEGIVIKNEIAGNGINNSCHADMVILKGYIYNPKYQEIEISAEGASSSRILIDEKPLFKNKYAEGVHSIQISLKVPAGNNVSLLLFDKVKNAKVPVPVNLLYTRAADNKAGIDYYDKGNKLVYKQNAAAINNHYLFYIRQQVFNEVNGPFKAVWNAKLYFNEAGIYSFKADSGYKTSLQIDGMQLKNNGNNIWDDITIKNGVHSIKLTGDFYIKETNFRFLLKKQGDYGYFTPELSMYR